MSRTTKIVLIIVVAVLLLFFALFYLLKGYMPKYRWDENYGYKNEQPYGTKLIFDVLSASRPAKNFTVINGSPENYLKGTDSTALYLFIGAEFYTDSINSEAFMDFVKRGNNVFISGKGATHYLFQFLTDSKYPTLYHETYSDTTVRVTFTKNITDSVFTFDYRFANLVINHNWSGYERAFITDTLSVYGFEPVSHINMGLIDCFRVKYGKGWFIFHFNPVLFTNYYLSKEKGLNYVNSLLSDYQKPKIYWDEFSKNQLGSGQGISHETPLRFILSERSLRWTWYLIMLFILLFVIFNSKRKQAYIPLLPSNRNTTVEYITAIATLHYQNNSLEFLAEEIMKQFLAFVKHKYGISPNLDKNEIARQLAPLSSVEYEAINNLFKRYLDVRYLPEVKYLIEFYELTEYFYQKCK
ncbi:MAG TPA: hypothetical protein VIH57_22645 [Bacteroidales bacterium]